MSAVFKAVTATVGRFVPTRLQPFYNHPAGSCSENNQRNYVAELSCLIR